MSHSLFRFSSFIRIFVATHRDSYYVFTTADHPRPAYQPPALRAGGVRIPSLITAGNLRHLKMSKTSWRYTRGFSNQQTATWHVGAFIPVLATTKDDEGPSLLSWELRDGYEVSAECIVGSRLVCRPEANQLIDPA